MDYYREETPENRRREPLPCVVIQIRKKQRELPSLTFAHLSGWSTAEKAQHSWGRTFRLPTARECG